jgi:histidyl-tRNA synthetase
MGDVVLLELLKARGLLPKNVAGIDVVVLVEDETLRAESLQLIARLRDGGCAVDYSLTALKPDKQFKRALDLDAAYTMKLERSTADGLTVRIKNLRSREEQVRSVEEAVVLLRV